MGGRIESGSIQKRRGSGKAIVARIWSLERRARFSKPPPL